MSVIVDLGMIRLARECGERAADAESMEDAQAWRRMARRYIEKASKQATDTGLSAPRVGRHFRAPQLVGAAQTRN